MAYQARNEVLLVQLQLVLNPRYRAVRLPWLPGGIYERANYHGSDSLADFIVG